MAATMPPTSNADLLEKRTVALPPSQWEDCEKLAAVNGEKLSEFYRRIITLGISAEKERHTSDLSYQNKEYINQRLEAKLEGAIKALNNLEALARHFGESPHERDVRHSPELLSIAAEFKTWLSE